MTTKQDSPPAGSASDSDTAEALPVELASGSGLNARQGGGDSVTIRTKLMELEACDNGMSAIAFNDDGFHTKARLLAPFLFEEVEITIRKVPKK